MNLMNTIKEKIKEWRYKLDQLQQEDKYRFLIDQAKSLKKIDEKYKIDEFKVPGCVSNMWLIPKIKDDRLYVQVDSDAILSKGTAAIIVDIFNGQKCVDIINTRKNDLTELGVVSNLNIINLLTPMRQNGLSNLIGLIFYNAGRQ